MQHPLRFGIWALVHGNRAALHDPEEPYDASWDRNRKLILEAEQLGYDYLWLPEHHFADDGYSPSVVPLAV